MLLWWYEIVLTGKEDGSVKDPTHRVHDEFFSIQQVHGNEIYHLDAIRTWYQTTLEWDAIVSKVSAIWVYTGDCLPIAILGKEYTAVVHGSWKTLHAWLLQKTVKYLCRQGEAVIDMQIFVWPCICGQVYEVGDEFVELFPAEYLQQREGKLFLDLPRYTRWVLEELWISANSIQLSAECTYTDNDAWFSRRKGERWRNFMGVRKLAVRG